MRVRNVMVHDVVTVPADATLADALHRMWTRDVGALPVTEAGRVVAMLDDRDVAMSIYFQRRLPYRSRSGMPCRVGCGPVA